MVCMCVCVYVCMVCMCVCVYVCMCVWCVCVYVCMCVCVYVCMVCMCVWCVCVHGVYGVLAIIPKRRSLYFNTYIYVSVHVSQSLLWNDIMSMQLRFLSLYALPHHPSALSTPYLPPSTLSTPYLPPSALPSPPSPA